MSDTTTIDLDINAGVIWLVLQVLRRNGKPDAKAKDASNEIIDIVNIIGGFDEGEER